MTLYGFYPYYKYPLCKFILWFLWAKQKKQKFQAMQAIGSGSDQNIPGLPPTFEENNRPQPLFLPLM